jgi:hypothetical protein
MGSLISTKNCNALSAFSSADGPRPGLIYQIQEFVYLDNLPIKYAVFMEANPE